MHVYSGHLDGRWNSSWALATAADSAVLYRMQLSITARNTVFTLRRIIISVVPDEEKYATSRRNLSFALQMPSVDKNLLIRSYPKENMPGPSVGFDFFLRANGRPVPSQSEADYHEILQACPGDGWAYPCSQPHITVARRLRPGASPELGFHLLDRGSGADAISGNCRNALPFGRRRCSMSGYPTCNSPFVNTKIDGMTDIRDDIFSIALDQTLIRKHHVWPLLTQLASAMLFQDQLVSSDVYHPHRFSVHLLLRQYCLWHPGRDPRKSLSLYCWSRKRLNTTYRPLPFRRQRIFHNIQRLV